MWYIFFLFPSLFWITGVYCTCSTEFGRACGRFQNYMQHKFIILRRLSAKSINDTWMWRLSHWSNFFPEDGMKETFSIFSPSFLLHSSCSKKRMGKGLPRVFKVSSKKLQKNILKGKHLENWVTNQEKNDMTCMSLAEVRENGYLLGSDNVRR